MAITRKDILDKSKEYLKDGNPSIQIVDTWEKLDGRAILARARFGDQPHDVYNYLLQDGKWFDVKSMELVIPEETTLANMFVALSRCLEEEQVSLDRKFLLLKKAEEMFPAAGSELQ